MSQSGRRIEKNSCCRVLRGWLMTEYIHYKAILLRVYTRWHNLSRKFHLHGDWASLSTRYFLSCQVKQNFSSGYFSFHVKLHPSCQLLPSADDCIVVFQQRKWKISVTLPIHRKRIEYILIRDDYSVALPPCSFSSRTTFREPNDFPNVWDMAVRYLVIISHQSIIDRSCWDKVESRRLLLAIVLDWDSSRFCDKVRHSVNEVKPALHHYYKTRTCSRFHDQVENLAEKDRYSDFLVLYATITHSLDRLCAELFPLIAVYSK